MKNLMNKLSFTRSETKVIIFIISVLVAGFSVKYYKQVISSSALPYNFTRSDSVFTARSFNNSNGSKDSAGSANDEKEKSDEFSGIVLNINTASKEDLVDLPGIGESIADKIIVYRESKKGFKRIEELMNVSGIGKKKFEKFKNYISTE